MLRRPPAVINAPGASDMNREWRILSALEGTSVPHPAPLLFGGPGNPLDGPFLIMARVDGFNPVGVLPPPYDTPGARRDLAFALVDALAELAAVPWLDRGLDGLGRPEGFLDRQVSRWLRQLDGCAGAEHGTGARAVEACQRHDLAGLGGTDILLLAAEQPIDATDPHV